MLDVELEGVSIGLRVVSFKERTENACCRPDSGRRCPHAKMNHAEDKIKQRVITINRLHCILTAQKKTLQPNRLRMAAGRAKSQPGCLGPTSPTLLGLVWPRQGEILKKRKTPFQHVVVKHKSEQKHKAELIHTERREWSTFCSHFEDESHQ